MAQRSKFKGFLKPHEFWEPQESRAARLHSPPVYADSDKFSKFNIFAEVAELADALDSGSSGSNTVWVQVPSPAPNQKNPNQIFQIGNGFGFFVYI